MNNQTIVQFSADTKIEGNTLTGYAHIFGQMTQVHGQWEKFSKGAFDKALKNSDPRAFLEHDRAKLLGRLSAGTLRIETTDLGLKYEIDLPNTTYANDLRELIARGDLNEMSFGFIPDKWEMSRAQDGSRLRTHTETRELVDVSPVSMPAFEGTSINLHSRSFDNEPLKSQLVRIRNRKG